MESLFSSVGLTATSCFLNFLGPLPARENAAGIAVFELSLRPKGWGERKRLVESTNENSPDGKFRATHRTAPPLGPPDIMHQTGCLGGDAERFCE